MKKRTTIILLVVAFVFILAGAFAFFPPTLISVENNSGQTADVRVFVPDNTTIVNFHDVRPGERQSKWTTFSVMHTIYVHARLADGSDLRNEKTDVSINYGLRARVILERDKIKVKDLSNR